MSARLTLLFFFSAWLLVAESAHAEEKNDSLFNVLMENVEARPEFLRKKLAKIERYKNDARREGTTYRFDNYLKIYNEYKSFIYDSAFTYAVKLQQRAYEMGDPVRIDYAKIKLGFVQVSSGLFKEALDTLETVHAHSLPDTMRTEYYYLMARAHYDLADFNRDSFYGTKYTHLGNIFMDSTLHFVDKSSIQYQMFLGLNNLRRVNTIKAQGDFEKIINNPDLSDTDLAVAASTLSYVYKFNGDTAKAKRMLMRAAIADIHASTTETLAMLNLADMLNKEGDVENAYRFVKIAMEDANFYGARHRKVQVAAVFPIIEGRQLSLVESKRRMLFIYASWITLLSVIILIFAGIIFKQFRKLRAAKRAISDANDILTDTNHQLVDANKIKEEYVWYYFTVTADYISKLDSLKKSMEMKLLTRKLDDVKFVVDTINIKKERDDLYHNFDMVFLKLFPNFVTTFNSFLPDEDQIHLKEGQLLTTELRIFALIRMGIHDNEKIARILDYSVTTIYTYKTRIRSKSTLANEEFDKQIMMIRAI